MERGEYRYEYNTSRSGGDFFELFFTSIIEVMCIGHIIPFNRYRLIIDEPIELECRAQVCDLLESLLHFALSRVGLIT